MYMYSARPRAKSLPDQEDFDPDYETEFDEEEGKRTRVDRDRGGPSLMEAMERERGLGIFLSHLKDAGLAEILLGSDDEEDNDSAGGFTIFAPTDRAWAKASKLVGFGFCFRSYDLSFSAVDSASPSLLSNAFRFLGNISMTSSRTKRLSSLCFIDTSGPKSSLPRMPSREMAG